MDLLKVEKLTKRFGHSTVLKDVSFLLKEGESLAIIGSSGSGKTTLLRCLNFLEMPDGGSVKLKGETLFDPNERYTDNQIREKRLHFGFVFQSFNLFPQYTAYENITLAPSLAAKKRPDYEKNKKDILQEIKIDAYDLLEQVGLHNKGNAYPHQLSGGQQQRVAIARALALKPDILCFDEPTSALDPELTGEVLKVIRGLSEANRSIIIVTHEMQFARDVADTILFLDNGLVAEYGTPEDVMDNPKSERMKQFLERYNAE